MEQKLSNTGTMPAKMNLCVSGILYWIKITNGGKWMRENGGSFNVDQGYPSGNVNPKRW